MSLYGGERGPHLRPSRSIGGARYTSRIIEHAGGLYSRHTGFCDGSWPLPVGLALSEIEHRLALLGQGINLVTTLDLAILGKGCSRMPLGCGDHVLPRFEQQRLLRESL